MNGGKNVFKHKEDFPVWAAVHSERRSPSMAKRHLFVLGHRSPLDSGAADSTTGAKFTEESESTSQADYFLKGNALFLSELNDRKSLKFN